MKPKIHIERIPAIFANIYEKAAKLVIDSYFGPIADEVVSSFGEGRLLDLGTGPGYLPIEIVRRSPLITIDAIDLGHKLIRMARQNALRVGVVSRISFEVGNAAELQFDSDTYDMVISTGMLHMLKDPSKVLKECYRVLKPGGKAWIYDPAQVSSKIDKTKWEASLTWFETYVYKLFLLYARINPPHTFDREQVIDLIDASPFEHCQIEEIDGEIKAKLKK
jgi:ubiquinone/menaquinone biosynthesis C-methylase UbiE